MDDLLVTRRNGALIQDLKQSLLKVFEMTDCGYMTLFFSWNGNQAR